MSTETPLERILRIRAERERTHPDEPQTMREWRRRNGWRPHPDYRPETLARLAQRTAHGEEFFFAFREFLDELYSCFTGAERSALIAERPQDLGDDRLDAFLGAMAEHVATTCEDVPRPAWAVEPTRFLDRCWWVGAYPGFWPTAVVQSPAAFRRRGVFIDTSMLSRM